MRETWPRHFFDWNVSLVCVEITLTTPLCVFWGISPSRRTLGRYVWGSSPNFTCSHIFMEIFLFYQTGKKRGNKKTLAYVRGGSSTRAFPWCLGTPSGEWTHMYVHKGTSSTTFQPYNTVKEVHKHMAWTQECMKVKHGYTLWLV